MHNVHVILKLVLTMKLSNISCKILMQYYLVISLLLITLLHTTQNGLITTMFAEAGKLGVLVL